MSKRVKVGVVGVDSGQVIICDPCYIDSQWDKADDFKDTRRYKDKKGKVYEYGKDFKHFEVVLFNDKTVNELVESKELIEIPNEVSHKFSYGGACSQTLGKNGFGQLNYELGHAGAGVVSRTAFGDGTYPVYAEVEKDGTVNSLTIEFRGTYTEKFYKKMVKGKK